MPKIMLDSKSEHQAFFPHSVSDFPKQNWMFFISFFHCQKRNYVTFSLFDQQGRKLGATYLSFSPSLHRFRFGLRYLSLCDRLFLEFNYLKQRFHHLEAVNFESKCATQIARQFFHPFPHSLSSFYLDC